MPYKRTTSNVTPLYFMAFESSAKVQFFQILQHSVATFCDISKIVNCMKRRSRRKSDRHCSVVTIWRGEAEHNKISASAENKRPEAAARE